jgi:hypothetical protein
LVCRAGPGEAGCPAGPADRTTVPITKPALGMSADYGLPPAPNTQLPDPNAKSTWSLNYSHAGVDTGEITIRGGSHLDFRFIPNQAFGASLRGADEIAWYTTAWFDKYLKHDPGADHMLLGTVRLAGLPGVQFHRVRVYEYTPRGLARRITRRVRGCG